jgi:hypothetical protein
MELGQNVGVRVIAPEVVRGLHAVTPADFGLPFHKADLPPNVTVVNTFLTV